MRNANLPNFLVIGAEKGGTTWLHYQLKKHPDIYLPETKEIHFFNKYDSNLKNRDFFKLGLKWYKEFFKKSDGEKAVGEVTPMYLCDDNAAERIKQTLPGVKLIVILRNPVRRAYSHYNMAFNKRHVQLPFDEVIKNEDKRFIKRGLYYKQLQKYYELFGKEKILVLFYEEVFRDALFWLKEICSFLEVDEAYFDSDETIYEKVFESSSYKSPRLLAIQNFIVHSLRRNFITSKILNWVKSKGVSDAVKKMNVKKNSYSAIDEKDFKNLSSYYKDDSGNLSKLLNRNLPYNL